MKFKFWKNKYKKIRLALHVWATWDFKVTTVTRALANLRLSFYSYVIGQLYNGPACKNHFFSSAAWTLFAFQAHDGNPFCLSRHYSGITAQQGQSHNHHISKKKRKNQAKCSFVAIWDRYSARGHSVRICLVSFSFFFYYSCYASEKTRQDNASRPNSYWRFLKECELSSCLWQGRNHFQAN